MLIVRGVNLLNHISKHAQRKNILTITTPSRFSHEWAYRPFPNPPKTWIIAAEIMGGFGWSWILYRLYYDYEDLTCHWKVPDPSKWTNEELGIPPDDSQ